MTASRVVLTRVRVDSKRAPNALSHHSTLPTLPTLQHMMKTNTTSQTHCTVSSLVATLLLIGLHLTYIITKCCAHLQTANHINYMRDDSMDSLPSELSPVIRFTPPS
ncbi:unnamed protein product, partial [Medioppia subpectinata]